MIDYARLIHAIWDAKSPFQKSMVLNPKNINERIFEKWDAIF